MFESESDRLQFMVSASETLLSSLDYDETMQALAHRAIPAIGDWCAVDMIESGGAIARLAVAHSDPAKVKLAHELWVKYPPRADDPAGVPHVVRTAQPEIVEHIPDSLLEQLSQDAEHLALIRSLGIKSYVVLPLRVHDRVLGAVTLVYAESGRRYLHGDLPVLQDFARVAAVGVENARLYREERQARLRAEALLKEVEAQSRDVQQLLLQMRTAREAAERRVAELEKAAR